MNKTELEKYFGILTDEQAALISISFPLFARNPRLFEGFEGTPFEYAQNIIADFEALMPDEREIVFAEITAFAQSIIDKLEPAIEQEASHV